jgi:hypothetical protein
MMAAEGGAYGLWPMAYGLRDWDFGCSGNSGDAGKSQHPENPDHPENPVDTCHHW